MNEQTAWLMEPAEETPELKLGNWIRQSADDPIVEYLAASLWEGSHPPQGWEVARRSQAVYIYRETRSRWQVVAKFYTVKTGEKAEKNARRELALIEQVRQASLSGGLVRAIRSYSAWRGVLFMEFVDGLTLEDVIAVRRSRPESVIPSLEKVAQFFARLHRIGASQEQRKEREDVSAEARRIVDNLSRYGVLKETPIVQDGLRRQIRRWVEREEIHEYTPALTHGDATTTNFIFTSQRDELVAIDWERSRIADPATDLGRIAAEVEHSIGRYGGNAEEARQLIEQFTQEYTMSLPGKAEIEGVLERARFYQAISSLRIARNGWLSRLERMQLVAQAMALLAL